MTPAPSERPAVLIVDDDRVDRTLVERLLGKHYALRQAADGASGLRALHEQKFECVLLDYLLPDSDGLQLLARMVEEYQGAIVMLTGEGSEAVAALAMQKGAHEYVVKGQLDGELLRRVIESARLKATSRRKLQTQQTEFRHFAFTAAHDLRAPFRKIRTYCQMLGDSLGASYGEPQRAIVERIERSVVSLDALIEGLLLYARMGHCEKTVKDVDLSEALSQALANLQMAIDEKHAVVESAGLPIVRGDPTALTLLLQNLVGNGIKFNRREPRVSVRASSEEGYWIVSVGDNGIGIAARHLAHLFKPFERLNNRNEFEGVGLGLVTCQRIVESHGGKIRVDSELERGSTVTFTLPK